MGRCQNCTKILLHRDALYKRLKIDKDKKGAGESLESIRWVVCKIVRQLCKFI